MTKRAPAGPMLLALFLVSCSSSASPSTAPPGASASTAPSASVLESATAEPTPAGKQVTAGPCCAGFAIDPGRYASPAWFAIPLTVDVGDGWRAFREDKNLAFSFVRGSNDVSHATQWLALFAPANEEVAAFKVDLMATPLLTFGDSKPIEVANYPGEQIDAQAAANPAEAGSDSRMPGTVDIHAMFHLYSHGITDFEFYTESAEARIRFIFVEIGDHTLILYLEAPAAEFDAYVELANSVLATLQLQPPAPG